MCSPTYGTAFARAQCSPTYGTAFACAQIIWGTGATEGGSSGSPLIDADTDKVMGVLTGGFSNCDQPKAPDYYGRLSKVCVAPSCGKSTPSGMWRGSHLAWGAQACGVARRQYPK